jgi:hypothetical protein
MERLAAKGIHVVLGPFGEPLTLNSLPHSETRRWVCAKKAKVVAAVNGGLLTLDDACRLYKLTEEEFASWALSMAKHGILGLRVTRILDYRR